MHTYTPPAAVVCEYTGTLLSAAEVRTKILGGDSYPVPVLCMELELDNTVHTHAHIEQNFAPGCHSQCEAAARRYKKGDHVTVHASLVDHRLVLPNVHHIQVTHQSTPALF